MSKIGEIVRVYAELDGMPYNAQRAIDMGAGISGSGPAGASRTVAFATLDDLDVALALTAGHVVRIQWGDGDTTNVTADGAEHTYSHEYDAPGEYSVRLVGEVEWLTAVDLGGQTVQIDLAEIGKCESATKCDLGAVDFVWGDLSDISTLALTYLDLSTATTPAVTGDIADLASMTGLTILDLYGQNSLTFSDVALPAWAGAAIDLSNVELSATEVDNFLLRLSTGIGATGILGIGGTNAARTSASDSAYSAFYAAGWTVICNQPEVAFTATDDFTLKMAATSGRRVVVSWGDASTTVWTCNGSEQTVLHNYASAGTYPVKIYGDLSAVTTIDLSSQTYVTVALAEFAKMPNLTSLLLSLLSTRLTGNLSSISALVHLVTLGVNNTSVVGNLSSISACTAMRYLYINSSAITGDIANLSAMTLMSSCTLNSSGVTGDLRNISSLTALTYFAIYATSMAYTSGSLPAWNSLTMYVSSCGLDSTEVDNFLIDFADGIGTPTSLNIAGTNAARTSASNAAKAAILATGCTLTVNE